ncbi:MAG TPA: tripartite tricarboxylate transporter substrate binding protein [Xanthobacteraceae bacterium]|jgi:tripartite-type tricarboxylate transporter receptor subunit TctC
MMKFPRRQFLHLVAGAVAIGVLFAQASWSQTPRAIKIVVPFAPGGAADFMARVLAEQVGRVHGRTAVVENRPGAGTVVGAEAVARAAPDGSTLLFNSKKPIINPHLRKVSYDALASFEPICRLVSSPTVISVNNESPYRTLAELLDAARARPGELTLASSGPASPFQIGFEMLKRAAHVEMTFIPYPGAAPAVNALLGQHVTSMLTTYSTVMEQLKVGKIRPLATTSLTRIEAIPNVPTGAELGYKDFEVDIWSGLVAPAKTPKETVSRLADFFTAAMQAPEVSAKLEVQGLYPATLCGADFDALIRKQYDEYGRVIREANITE